MARTGSKRDGVPKTGGFATPDLEAAAIFLGNEPPGCVFAAGDVRSGSVKRVASAVGKGSMAVQFVHEYLKPM